MNLSGDSIGPALRFFKLPLEALVVIHDEIDLAAGKLKVKTAAAMPGRTGCRSVTAALGPDYRRVRWASAIPATRSGSPAMCCRIFPGTTSPG